MTTFSMMSDPDILLTTEAYTRLKVQAQQDIRYSEIAPAMYPKTPKELIALASRVERLEELIASLMQEWQKRGNL